MVEIVHQERAREQARLGLGNNSTTVERPMDIDDGWLKPSVDNDKNQFKATNSELLDDGEGKRFRVGGEVTTEDVQQQQRMLNQQQLQIEAMRMQQMQQTRQQQDQLRQQQQPPQKADNSEI